MLTTQPTIDVAPAIRAQLDAEPCYVCRGKIAVWHFRSAHVGIVVGELVAIDLPKFCDDHAEMFMARLAQICRRASAAEAA